MSNGEANAEAQQGLQCQNTSPPQDPQMTSSLVATLMGHSPSSADATINEHSSSQQSTVSLQQPSDATAPVDTQEPETLPEPDTLPGPDTATAIAPVQGQAPKQVFSLFLSPEQRKKKMEAEATAAVAAAAATATASNKRGKKSKGKGSVNIAGASTISTIPKPSIDPKTTVDPNISKTGETHPFFQEVKATQALATASSAAVTAATPAAEESNDGPGSKARSNSKRFNPKPQESPFPLFHQQFHGSETIDTINGVVARLCGLDATASPPTTMEPSRSKERKLLKRSSQNQSEWYNLRSSPDLGITAPQYKLKGRGKDGWTYWGDDRDQKWRKWSEKCHRLQKPTDKERQLINKQIDQAEEFESCQRVAADQQIWQKTWSSELLTAVGLTPGSAEVPIDLKIGELWTEKYRPIRGADVLGNRANTEYLTQWLSGLEVSRWTLNPEESSAGGTRGAGLIRKSSDIMGAARKRRKRPRRKGASELDDFVVYDDAEDFEDPYGYLSEEEDGFFAAPRPLSTFSHLAHSDLASERDSNRYSGSRILPKEFDIKSNAILLSGRTGSCKTAAVYACAEESGYEVFEVSPATRRTGKEVLGLVGEMAENHHVHVIPGKSDSKDDIHSVMIEKRQESSSSVTTPQSTSASSPAPAPAPAPPSTSTIHSFFNPSQYKKYRDQTQEKKQQDEDVTMGNSSDVDVEGYDDDQDSPASHYNDTPGTGTPPSPSPSSTKEEDKLSDLYSLLTTTNPRQSLILLEEVDILFEDDKGFWASIVALLSKSRRPVVMTCNDTSKIPTATLRFQEHLEFERPSFRELYKYLSLICKIEGYICSSEYIMALIKHCRHDVRRCLMQLQYDSGVVRSKPQWSGSSSHSYSNSRSDSPASDISSPSTCVNGDNKIQTTGSPVRKKPQRLLRINAKGIVPASAPTIIGERKTIPNPLQELEKLEVQAQYAESMSLCDSGLRMKTERALQCYEADQSEASKDDVVGQHFSIYKRPTGADHLLLDQECASLFEEGCESLYIHQAGQLGFAQPYIFEGAAKLDDPARSVAENFVPLNENLSENLQKMQPALEQTLSLHGLRFNVDTTFETFAPLLRSMIQAEDINTFVPSGKRTMRSGGHLKRHLSMLSDSERTLMLSSSFSLPPA
ncbi:hypothetical protein BGX27_003286 [Mortierella sp. AM989]|nr:hypothetical protein BGX27_003286 [Mortierella sp. AM989]